MLTIIWVFVVIAWMPVAFAGALGFVPLTGLLGLVSLAYLKRIHVPIYGWALLLGLVYAAITSLWSPYTSPLMILDFDDGDFSIKSAAIRVTLVALLASSMLAAIPALPKKHIGLILSTFLAALVMQAIGLLLVYFFRDQVFELFKDFTTDRISAIMNLNRNIAVFGIGSVFILGLIVGAKTLLGEMRHVLATFVAAAVAVLFFKFSAIVAMVAVIGAFIALYIPSIFGKYTFRVLGLGTAAFILLSPLLFSLLVLVNLDVPATSDDSFHWRILIWQEVIERASEKPILGWGLDSLRTFSDVFQDGPWAGQTIIQTHAHNMMLHIWVETGYVGVLFTSFIILAIGWALPDPEELGPYAGKISCGLWAACLIVGIGSFSVWNEWWWALISISIALIMLFYRGWIEESRV